MKGLFYQGYQCNRCSVASHRECIPALPAVCGPHPYSHNHHLHPRLHQPELPPRPPSMLPSEVVDFSQSSLEHIDGGGGDRADIELGSAAVHRQSSLASLNNNNNVIKRATSPFASLDENAPPKVPTYFRLYFFELLDCPVQLIFGGRVL